MKSIRKFQGFYIPVWVVMVLVAGPSLNGSPAEAAEAPRFPIKPITILNSSAAGSPADVMARQLAEQAKKHLGQPVVVVDKPGGSGGVMFASLMADPADGYTLSTMTAALISSLHGALKKDFSIDNFEFLANVQKEPYCLTVRADSPIKTLPEMIAYAKKNPRLKIAGQGTYSQLHLMTLVLAEEAGMPISWVPVSGGADGITTLLGGHVPVVTSSPATMIQYVEAGKVRILAVSGDKRLSYWSNVPTLKELGYNIVITQYRGIGARKGLPPDVKAILVNAIKKAVAEPGFKSYMAKNYQDDAFMGPEEFTAAVRADYEYMGKLMQRVEKKK